MNVIQILDQGSLSTVIGPKSRLECVDAIILFPEDNFLNNFTDKW